jgi:hypothetical protein
MSKSDTETPFSLSDMNPSAGDLSRSPEGTVAYYEVPDFKVGGAIQTYANSTGAKISTQSLYCFEARSPDQINKLLKITVIKSGRPKVGHWGSQEDVAEHPESN